MTGQWKANGEKSARSELAIQTLFRSRARILCPAVKIVAVPNGTHIASRAGRNKANMEGRSAGFPDVMCLWSHGKDPASAVPNMAFIEFKAGGGGQLSETQSYWLDWLDTRGFKCRVSRDPDDALDFLKRCGAPFVGAITA